MKTVHNLLLSLVALDRSVAFRRLFCLTVLVILAAWQLPVQAEDWPTCRKDRRRSGVTEARLAFPLAEAWRYGATHAPRPSWPESPAKDDIAAKISKLTPAVVFDNAFGIVAAGGRVFFGSSADDAVRCLDLDTGELQWVFTTEGPIHLAPAVAGDRVFVGSDDGRLYSLGAETGKLQWRFDVDPEGVWLPGNGRFISRKPVRGGIVVDDATVYFGAGLFPSRGVELFALETETGKPRWRKSIPVSAQGPIAASEEMLIVPTGRTAPTAFSRCDGRQIGKLGSLGGCFALVAEDCCAFGTDERGQMRLVDPKTREGIVAIQDGIRMIADGPMVYVMTKGSLYALDREAYLAASREVSRLGKKKKRTDKENQQFEQAKRRQAEARRWTTALEGPFYELIKADDRLLLGADGQVMAFDVTNGKIVWSGEVEGKAYRLAVAEGRLLVSTDQGVIQGFASANKKKVSRKVSPKGTVQPISVSKKPSPTAGDRKSETTSGCMNQEKIARAVLENLEQDQGYAMVLDPGDGELIRALAEGSRFQIVSVEEDRAQLAALVKRFHLSGIYGPRVALRQGRIDEVDFQRQTMNLIVSESFPDVDRVARWARPCGGTVVLVQPEAIDKATLARLRDWGRGKFDSWEVSQKDGFWMGIGRRGALPGAGQWTHGYAEPGNTACSRDLLVTSPVEMQWFGRPGPGGMVDRHQRTSPPMYLDGRLFVPGSDRVSCVDAYNGTILWERAIPGSCRLSIPHDCSGFCVDPETLYAAAADRCVRLDVRNGQEKKTFSIPPSENETRPHEWGYLARMNGLLLGSACKKGAIYRSMIYQDYKKVWWRGQVTITSDRLFALDSETGKPIWQYRPDGVVPNPTIAAGDGCLFFLDSQSEKAKNHPTGRMETNILFDGDQVFLTAVDLETGKARFRKRVEVNRFGELVYLVYCDGRLILGGTSDGEKMLTTILTFDSRSGEPLWSKSHPSGLNTDGAHGENTRHPIVVGGKVYAWPYAYDLKTGEKVEGWKFDRGGHGCGEIAASQYGLFWRGNTPWMCDLEKGNRFRLSQVTRIGCWINAIPAGGLILLPESGAGCTCPYSIQTSIALVPKEPVLDEMAPRSKEAKAP